MKETPIIIGNYGTTKRDVVSDGLSRVPSSDGVGTRVGGWS